MSSTTIRCYYGPAADMWPLLQTIYAITDKTDVKTVKIQQYLFCYAVPTILAQLDHDPTQRAGLLKSLLAHINQAQTIAGLETILLTLLYDLHAVPTSQQDIEGGLQAWNKLGTKAATVDGAGPMFFYDLERRKFAIFPTSVQNEIRKRTFAISGLSGLSTSLQAIAVRVLDDPFGFGSQTTTSNVRDGSVSVQSQVLQSGERPLLHSEDLITANPKLPTLPTHGGSATPPATLPSRPQQPTVPTPTAPPVTAGHPVKSPTDPPPDTSPPPPPPAVIPDVHDPTALESILKTLQSITRFVAKVIITAGAIAVGASVVVCLGIAGGLGGFVLGGMVIEYIRQDLAKLLFTDVKVPGQPPTTAPAALTQPGPLGSSPPSQGTLPGAASSAGGPGGGGFGGDGPGPTHPTISTPTTTPSTHPTEPHGGPTSPPQIPQAPPGSQPRDPPEPHPGEQPPTGPPSGPPTVPQDPDIPREPHPTPGPTSPDPPTNPDEPGHPNEPHPTPGPTAPDPDPDHPPEPKPTEPPANPDPPKPDPPKPDPPKPDPPKPEPQPDPPGGGGGGGGGGTQPLGPGDPIARHGDLTLGENPELPNDNPKGGRGI